MSIVDDHPPKYLDVGSLNHPERVSIFHKAIKRTERRVFFTCEELRVLILKESVVPLSARNMSRKEYKAAFDMKERARKYLEEEKQKTEDY